jgi:ABC-type Na+ transport system ATPase subunit NatA
MSAPDTPAIRTAGLGKRYGSLWALRDCSVSVPRGRVTALVGPNGAGKTTLLKILVGLSAPGAGEASVLGRPPEQSAEFLASIGYLAQDVPLYNRLTIADHLESSCRRTCCLTCSASATTSSCSPHHALRSPATSTMSCRPTAGSWGPEGRRPTSSRESR